MSKMKDPENNLTLNDLFDYSRVGDERLAKTSPNELASMLRQMFKELTVRPADWDIMANRFYRFIRGDDVKVIAQEKINLSRSLVKDDLTWGRFLEAIMVLGFDEYVLEVTLVRRHNDKDIKFRRRVRNPLRGESEE